MQETAGSRGLARASQDDAAGVRPTGGARRVRAAIEQAWREARRYGRRRPAGVVSLVVLVAVAAGVFLGPSFVRQSPVAVDPAGALSPPSREHWLGTDELGRDVLVRLLHGGRVTLSVGVASMVLSLVLGTATGAVAGFYRGWAEVALMRLTDAVMAIPQFFLVLPALTVLGSGTLWVILVIALTSWMQTARVVYGDVRKWAAQEFVESAYALGATRRRVLVRHVLPQTLPVILVNASMGVAYAILVESAISYLGLGVQPPTPSWGSMLQNAQTYVWTSPWLAVYPGLLISVTVFAFHFLGDALQQWLDPHRR